MRAPRASQSPVARRRALLRRHVPAPGRDGQIFGGRNGAPTPLAFPPQLAEVGVYHYKARAYHPALGRFMQPDPIGYADGPNLYAYAGNDPVNRIDPTGLSGEASHQPAYDVIVVRYTPDGSSGGGGGGWSGDEIIVRATRSNYGPGIDIFPTLPDFFRDRTSLIDSVTGGGGGRRGSPINEIADRILEAACDLAGNDVFQATVSGAAGGAVTGGLIGNGLGALLGGIVGGVAGGFGQIAADRFGNSSLVGGAVGGISEFLTGGRAPGIGGGAVGGIIGGPIGGFIGGGLSAGGNNAFNYSRSSIGNRFVPTGSAFSNLAPEFSRGLLQGGVAGVAGAATSAGVTVGLRA